MELSQALLKLAQQQKEAGTGTGIEVTRAQVQLANDRQRLIVAENDRRARDAGTAAHHGAEAGRCRWSSPTSCRTRPVDVATLEASLDEARKERAELKAQQQREEAARLTYGSVKAERLPSVAAFGDYGNDRTSRSTARGRRATYGVSLKVPIFDGFRREARRAESTSQYQQEQIRTRDLEQQMELEVRLALESLRSAKAQVRRRATG